MAEWLKATDCKFVDIRLRRFESYFFQKINNFFHKNLKNRLCKIVLIPHYVFEPCTMDNICEITNDTVAMHIFASSWVDDGHKWFVKFYYKLKPYLLTIAIIAIFLIIIWFRK